MCVYKYICIYTYTHMYYMRMYIYVYNFLHLFRNRWNRYKQAVYTNTCSNPEQISISIKKKKNNREHEWSLLWNGCRTPGKECHLTPVSQDLQFWMVPGHCRKFEFQHSGLALTSSPLMIHCLPHLLTLNGHHLDLRSSYHFQSTKSLTPTLFTPSKISNSFPELPVFSNLWFYLIFNTVVPKSFYYP